MEIRSNNKADVYKRQTQVSLTNWAAGGDNSVAFDLQGTYQINYKKGKHLWNNRIELAYGLDVYKRQL